MTTRFVLATFAIALFSLSFLTDAHARELACYKALDVPHFGGTEKELAVFAKEYLLANISAKNTAPGTVLASPAPNHGDPNYRYHWVRDAALTMDLVRELWRHAAGDEKAQLEKRLFDYIGLSLDEQRMDNPWSLGEVRYLPNGTRDTAGWMRPQYDGPALRALTLSRFADSLLDLGRENEVREKLYSANPYSLIKRDLEFVSLHWRERSFDLWEEVNALNFNTLAGQKTSLLVGAKLADRLGDHGAAAYFRDQAQEIGKTLERFWNGERGYIVAALDHVNPDGLEAKRGGLDIATILAALQSSLPGEPWGVTDDRILATAQRLRVAFGALYEINHRPDLAGLGEAIGRYPEDTYNGWRVGETAHPWFLATNALAELCYRAAREYQAKGEIHINETNMAFFSALRGMQGEHLSAGQTHRAGSPVFAKLVHELVLEGDRFIARTIYHAGTDGHMSEQFSRVNGYLTGAPDLTWSYASYLSALLAKP